MTGSPNPRRGEIWTAYLEDGSQRHWVVVVSVDTRNLSERTSSILVIPFGSYGRRGPTVAEFQPDESGLPVTSYLKAHFIQVLAKSQLVERQRRNLTSTRIKEVVEMIRRSVDPDAPWLER